MQDIQKSRLRCGSNVCQLGAIGTTERAMLPSEPIVHASRFQVVVERLLSISGEDNLTVDRKYRECWTGRLSTRFVILTNELPRLSDSSGALASTFIPLVLTKSFYGSENPLLTDDLLTEAPAIFNWALEGLDRLNQRGYFLNPDSAKDAIQQLEDLSSPISAFIRDMCLVGNHEVEVETLWAG
jgi:putative DNA primase/helicase